MGEFRARTRLGPYRLLAALARRGDDVLYRAQHEGHDREVLLRVLSAPSAEETDVRELRRLRALVHPNVVRILDVGEAESSVYVALESWAEDLEVRCREKPLTFAKKLGSIEGICGGLAAAHFMGIVHGALHAFQVRLAHDERAQVDYSQRRAPAVRGLPTRHPAYLCPEQARGQRQDLRSDVFSASCLAYELLTGRRPFEGGTLHAVLYRTLHEDPIPPRQLAPEVEAPLEEWLLRGLAKEPSQRFQNAHEMVLALRLVRAN